MMMLTTIATIGAGATSFGLFSLALWPQSALAAICWSVIGGIAAWIATRFDKVRK